MTTEGPLTADRKAGEMQFDELLSLCKDVIPKTWNVYKYCDINSVKMERGILNIELEAYVPLKKNIKSVGSVSPIRYLDGVGHTKISIYCYPIWWASTLLHELAHVAVFRLESYIIKSYYAKLYYNNGCEIESNPHGKIFDSYLNTIEKRAMKKGWTFFEIKSNKIWQKL